MTVQTIDPNDAKRLLEEKAALLVDIREPAEHARESIEGARLVPLARIDTHDFTSEQARHTAVIFHCQSGGRTNANAVKLAGCGFGKAYVLKGGISGWKAAGLPTRLDHSKPIELQRQVQIAAGTLILLAFILAITISPWFAGLAAFVGAGLVFAGISGWCGMARVLRIMPWNHVTD